MKRLEKIFAVGGIVIGLSLIGYGLYRDSKFPEYKNYVKNTIIKAAGLFSFAIGSGLGLRQLVEEDEKRHFEEYNNNSPR